MVEQVEAGGDGSPPHLCPKPGSVRRINGIIVGLEELR